MENKNSARNPVIYSNKISRELLPGMIKPLVWSINIPVVNSSWKNLFKELTGSAADSIRIEKLARCFYYRAYFNMSVVGDFFELLGISRDALEVISGIKKASNSKGIFKPSLKILRYLPRMTVFGFKLYFFNKKIEQFLRQKTRQYKKIDNIVLKDINFKNCFNVIDRLILIHQDSSYIVILTQILNSIYNQALKRINNDKEIYKKIIYSNLEKNMLAQIDPEKFISKLNSFFNKLPKESQKVVLKTDYLTFKDDPKIGSFRKEFDIFMKRFGHLSDNANDFSKTTWKENPELALRMIVYHYPSSEMNFSNPKSKSGNSEKTNFLSKFITKRAKQYQIYRGSIGFVYNFGFGLFRKLFLFIGQVFKEKNMLDSKEDIFYLKYEEIKNLSRNPSLKNKYNLIIDERKRQIIEYQTLDLPEVIFDDLPQSKIKKRIAIKNLIGIASSRGIYSGVTKVVLGIEDFDKIQKGDVLIIPYSDPGWTPLFSKAGAIISESGGLLSHCSIIAREYGIPAIVSVKGALQIQDGTKIMVDGCAGKVKILDT